MKAEDIVERAYAETCFVKGMIFDVMVLLDLVLVVTFSSCILTLLPEEA